MSSNTLDFQSTFDLFTKNQPAFTVRIYPSGGVALFYEHPLKPGYELPGKLFNNAGGAANLLGSLGLGDTAKWLREPSTSEDPNFPGLAFRKSESRSWAGLTLEQRKALGFEEIGGRIIRR